MRTSSTDGRAAPIRGEVSEHALDALDILFNLLVDVDLNTLLEMPTYMFFSFVVDTILFTSSHLRGFAFPSIACMNSLSCQALSRNVQYLPYFLDRLDLQA